MLIVLLLLVVVVLLLLLSAILHSIFGLLLFLIVATLCGAVAVRLLGEREGVGETLLIGVAGAALGAIVARVLHLPGILPSIAGVPIVWTIVGSVIVVAILKMTRSGSSSVRRVS